MNVLASAVGDLSRFEKDCVKVKLRVDLGCALKQKRRRRGIGNQPNHHVRFGSSVPIDRRLSGARGAPGRSPDSQVSRFPGRHLAARGRVSTVCGACVGPWKTGILKTCRPARPSRGLPLRSRARGVRCVPGVPEWPAAGQWRGGHGPTPHGAAPRVASGAREVTSQEGRRDARGGAFAWAGIPMSRIGTPNSRAGFSAHPSRGRLAPLTRNRLRAMRAHRPT